jgi:hypothetical protein
MSGPSGGSQSSVVPRNFKRHSGLVASSRINTDKRYTGDPKFAGAREVFDHFDVAKAGTHTGWANASFGMFFSDNKDAVLEFAETTRDTADERPCT